MLEVVKDDQCLLPGITRCLDVACGVASVAKADESVGFEMPVAESAVEAEGAAITFRGLGQVTEVLLGIAEAVPTACLPVVFAELSMQDESLPTENTGTLRFPQENVIPASVVECRGPSGLIADGLK